MWVEFWFESYIVAQVVSDPKDWDIVSKTYLAAYDRDIYQCRRDIYQYANGRTIANFGALEKHRGDDTLGEFFDRHNMPRT